VLPGRSRFNFDLVRAWRIGHKLELCGVEFVVKLRHEASPKYFQSLNVCMALVKSGGDGQGGIMTTTRRFFVSMTCATERSPDCPQAHSVIAARGPAPPRR
jgi:hypothetical protein